MEFVIRRIRVFLPFIYKLVFEILFAFFISESFSYFGTYLEINYIKLAVSWLVFTLLLFGINLLKEDLFKCFFRIMLYFSIIPSFSIFGLKNEKVSTFALLSLYWFVFLACVFIVQHLNQYCNIQSKKTYLLNGNERILWFFFLW